MLSRVRVPNPASSGLQCRRVGGGWGPAGTGRRAVTQMCVTLCPLRLAPSFLWCSCSGNLSCTLILSPCLHCHSRYLLQHPSTHSNHSQLSWPQCPAIIIDAPLMTAPSCWESHSPRDHQNCLSCEPCSSCNSFQGLSQAAPSPPTRTLHLSQSLHPADSSLGISWLIPVSPTLSSSFLPSYRGWLNMLCHCTGITHHTTILAPMPVSSPSSCAFYLCLLDN